ncbi:MAG: diguanylate cyclase [Candidatus Omnitrophica bacterium]|nr:diguanylate cyclase [Candidatus Omnitrophota bacterium]
MIKTTLQSRLIVFTVISSVFLISIFTLIQISNQLGRVQEFNIYRANQSALVIKDKLTSIFSSLPAGAPSHQAIKEIERSLADFIESGAVDTALVLDKEGNPVTMQGKLNLVFEEDKNFLKKLAEPGDNSKWLVSFVDKENRLVNLFIKTDNPYGFYFKLVFSLGNLQQALNQVYGPVILIMLVVILANVILAFLLSKTLVVPVKMLNQATKDIAAGNLDRKVSILTHDELEELSDTFNHMTGELKKMKERAENANPLTKLPGNVAIREEAERRIKNGREFILIYADLDNFKAFNDKHGVSAGDEAIMLTANIMREAISKKGEKEDFLGHEGGDDFLLLTIPERAEKLAGYIIKEFDRRITGLYTKEELEKGHIEAKGRESGVIKVFPIMSISLVGAGNYCREIISYSQLTNVIAELKKAAKMVQKSNFLIDRRKQDDGKGEEFRHGAGD